MSSDFDSVVRVSQLFMGVLLSWALVWIVLGCLRLRKRTNRPLFWKTHIFWNMVNATIAALTLLTLNPDSYGLEQLRTNCTIVAVNIVLDVVYIVVAIFLRKKSGTKDIGDAVLIQGSFLLVLDVAIVAYLTSQLA